MADKNEPYDKLRKQIQSLEQNEEKLLKERLVIFMSGCTSDVIAHQGMIEEGLYFINTPSSRQALSVKLTTLLDSAHSDR